MVSTFRPHICKYFYRPKDGKLKGNLKKCLARLPTNVNVSKMTSCGNGDEISMKIDLNKQQNDPISETKTREPGLALTVSS